MSSARDVGANGSPVVLNHVQLAAPPGCEQQARAFYGDLLGLRELEKPGPARSAAARRRPGSGWQ